MKTISGHNKTTRGHRKSVSGLRNRSVRESRRSNKTIEEHMEMVSGQKKPAKSHSYTENRKKANDHKRQQKIMRRKHRCTGRPQIIITRIQQEFTEGLQEVIRR